MTDILSTLSAAESDLLAECEQVIERGIKTFIETGNALADIRDNRLYRIEFDTFAAYCEQRWSLGESRAYQLIDGAAVAKLISSTTVEKINNEAQARELAPLLDDPDELRDVFAEAVTRTGGKPTAAAIREVRQEREPDVEPAPAPVDVMAGRTYPAPPPPASKTWNRPNMPPPDAVRPSAVPTRADLDDAGQAAEDRYRRGSAGFEDGLVHVWLTLDPDPVAWFANRYRPTGKYRNLPQARDAFTSANLRVLAQHLATLADHIDQTGATL